jgi:hypothetical protein
MRHERGPRRMHPGAACVRSAGGLLPRGDDLDGEGVGEEGLVRTGAHHPEPQLPDTERGVAGDLQRRIGEELRVVCEPVVVDERVHDRRAAHLGEQLFADRLTGDEPLLIRPSALEPQAEAALGDLGAVGDADAEAHREDLLALCEPAPVDGRGSEIEVDGAVHRRLVHRLREGAADRLRAERVGEPAAVERVLVADPVRGGGVLGVGDRVGEARVTVPLGLDQARVAVVAALDVDADPVGRLRLAPV